MQVVSSSDKNYFKEKNYTGINRSITEWTSATTSTYPNLGHAAYKCIRQGR